MFDIAFPMNVINGCPALWEPMMNSWCADQNKLLILKDWGPGLGHGKCILGDIVCW